VTSAQPARITGARRLRRHGRSTPRTAAEAFSASSACRTQRQRGSLADGLAANARDIILVIVNDTEYGGSGGAVAVASLHALATELVLHENGHTFAALADEYNYSHPPASPRARQRECDARDETRAHQVAALDRCSDAGSHPGSANGVPGLYEGAVYCVSGAYRPPSTPDALPGATLRTDQYEQHIRRVYNLVSPSMVEPIGLHRHGRARSAHPFFRQRASPRTHGLSVTWFVDGSRGDGAPVHSDTLVLGVHRIEARCRTRRACAERSGRSAHRDACVGRHGAERHHRGADLSDGDRDCR